ncbi:Uma2 family endonuclease [Bacillus sp. CECT 9360]|uniref:Uma2 family endonuclease n=1 Tax=Bacillus sp. CECT 9360 TaxID=2845821 RepID=UPI001E2CF43F|nr:Uma2 family endonuclease [Bacillus sp. CECT 9360]CAH0343937.1 hypothetical protein BCI9360_00164 [Bacillus sp. CECT 9360]
MSSIKPNPKKITYAEYLTWPDEPRYDKGCNGAPDLIIEVLSPSTWQKDRIEKLNIYQKHGVKEYLLMYPNERVVEQYILTEEDVYGTPFIYKEDVLRSLILRGFEVDMIDIFS